VIIGDWMSEANMTSLSSRKFSQESTGDPFRALPGADGPAYEATFLEALAPALQDLARHRIKVAVNAGGLATHALWTDVCKMVYEAGLGSRLNVAWVEGDDVLEIIHGKLAAGGDTFQNLCTGESLKGWDFESEIVGAQAYVGGLGIKLALERGADIVICGRVSDASPVIGAAAWWHGWDGSNIDELARAFVAGHMIECSNYVCGGNFTGFKDLEAGNGWQDIGYPIAEIGSSGEVIITKQKETGGTVNVDTCKAQLLYEIQGPWYFNSDVTAILSTVTFSQLGINRVSMSGIQGALPPPTTKVGITARGGWQAEAHWFLVGLDIEAKARMLETQIRHALGDTRRFHVLTFTTIGRPLPDPTDQNSATVDFRVFAQARDPAAIAPDRFLRPIMDLIMCSYPGATFHLDFRQGLPKPVFEYFVTLLPQRDISHVVHTHDGKHISVAPPSETRVWDLQQPSQATTINGRIDFGETIRGPLGWLVHARSGDKGSNANVGFWVRSAEEWEWLRSLLSTEKIISAS
jgi:hypothetical protein